MDPVQLAAFQDELELILKEAGVMGQLGKKLTAPIAGTKPWLLGRGGGSALRTTARPLARATRSRGGTYDVSALAKQMGV